MKKTYLAILVAVGVLMTAPFSWALWEKGNSLEGTITSINSSAIILSSTSADGQSVQVTNLAINNETKLGNVASLSELKAGDKVKVDFKDEGPQKVALNIDKQAAAGAAENKAAPGAAEKAM